VGRTYSKNANVIVPSLEDWKTHWQESQNKIALSDPSSAPVRQGAKRQALLAASSTLAQGTFQNLDFESVTLVAIPGDSYDRVEFGLAFPGR